MSRKKKLGLRSALGTHEAIMDGLLAFVDAGIAPEEAVHWLSTDDGDSTLRHMAAIMVRNWQRANGIRPGLAIPPNVGHWRGIVSTEKQIQAAECVQNLRARGIRVTPSAVEFLEKSRVHLYDNLYVMEMTMRDIGLLANFGTAPEVLRQAERSPWQLCPPIIVPAMLLQGIAPMRIGRRWVFVSSPVTVSRGVPQRKESLLMVERDSDGLYLMTVYADAEKYFDDSERFIFCWQPPRDRRRSSAK